MGKAAKELGITLPDDDIDDVAQDDVIVMILKFSADLEDTFKV